MIKNKSSLTLSGGFAAWCPLDQSGGWSPTGVLRKVDAGDLREVQNLPTGIPLHAVC